MAGRGNGTREESWLEKGADTELVWNHGQGQSTPDTGAVRPVGGDGVQTSEEDRVKMSAFKLLCEIFASNPC